MGESKREKFLARISKDGSKQYLEQHSSSVSVLCGQLASKIGMQHCGELLGLLHDMGKYTEAWQEYLLESFQNNGKVKKRNHSALGARYVWEKLHPIHTLPADMLTGILCGHHGGLPNYLTPEGNDGISGRLYPNEELFYEEAKENFYVHCKTEEEMKTLYEKAYEEFKRVYPKVKKNAFHCGLIEKLLHSCLLDADRLDAACFDMNRSPSVKEDYQALWITLSERLEEHIKDFSLRDGASEKEQEIYRLRSVISEECWKAAFRETGIYFLSCPTGSGKTLASLRFALEHARQKGKKHIFYIIPYLSILDQTASEIRNALAGAEGWDDSMLLEIHSGMTEKKVKGDEEEKLYELISERMDAPIILTTMVGFLHIFYGGNTKHNRLAHQFADSVILFDEVQKVPLHTVYPFIRTLNFLHNVCDSTSVLCTATQPMLDRIGTEEKLCIAEKPELCTVNAEIFKAFERTKLIDERRKNGYSPEALADRILQEKAENALIVLNTKKSVHLLYEALKESTEEYKLYCLTTYLCAAHRRKLFDEIRQKLPNGEKLIVVSTALIEAGVDISFPCVFRAIAGMDSIVQAAGRCNRHGQETERKPVYIVNPDFEHLDKGLPDIKIGAQQTRRVIDEIKAAPEKYGGELLCPEAVEKYFLYYFSEQQKKLDYEAYGKTFSELLGSNAGSYAAYAAQQGEPFSMFMRQSFQSAGDAFAAIEEYGKPVIVPYERGREIIAALCSMEELGDLKKLLREAQQYTVNLSPSDFQAIGDGIRYLEDLDIYILKEPFYDKQKGVVTESHAGLDIK